MKMPATYPSRLMTCCLPFYSGLEGEASWTPASCTHSFPLSLRLTMYYLHAANMLSQTFNSQRRITRKKSILSVYYSNIKCIETSENFLKRDFCSLFDFSFFCKRTPVYHNMSVYHKMYLECECMYMYVCARRRGAVKGIVSVWVFGMRLHFVLFIAQFV